LLLAEILGKSRGWVLSHGEHELAAAEASTVQTAIRRRQAGEPLPYILGWWEFFGRRFRVSPATLIPRPETELLVEMALESLHGKSGGRWAADIGTGTGCIAITLAAEVKDLNVVATDISREALRTARLNAGHHQVQGRLSFVQGDLARCLRGSFDIVCGNLPYVPTGELAGLAVSRWEPRLALDGGADGLKVLRRTFRDLPRQLKPGGVALFEIGEGQRQMAEAAAQQWLPGWDFLIRKDLAGRDRVLRLEAGRSGRA
jgi:release factor glutamine methyltransferase